MEDSSDLQETLKLIRNMADGTIGQEIEILTTRGLRVVKAHKGFLLCDFIIHNSILDENGNWDVGAIAILVDIIGSSASYSLVSYPLVTADFSISYYSTAKAQEEVEVEAKVVGKKGILTSVIVEVRKKESGELVALGKLWMRVVTGYERRQASKL